MATGRNGHPAGIINADVTLDWHGTVALLEVLASDHAGPTLLPVAQTSRAHGPVRVYSALIEGTGWRLGLVVPEYQVHAGVSRIFLLSLALGPLALQPQVRKVWDVVKAMPVNAARAARRQRAGPGSASGSPL